MPKYNINMRNYLKDESVQLATKKILEDPKEHRVGSVINTVISRYFNSDKYIITPEQTQSVSNKRPDLVVDVVKDNELLPHTIVELKSALSSDGWVKIAYQLIKATLENLAEVSLTNECYLIMVKGTKKGFFIYTTYWDNLSTLGIHSYNGILPIDFVFTKDQFKYINERLNRRPISNNSYAEYCNNIPRFLFNQQLLHEEGVSSSPLFPRYPSSNHIFDLLKHPDFVHELFNYSRQRLAGFGSVVEEIK